MGALVIEGFILSALGSAAGIVIGVAGSRLLSAIPAIGRYMAVRPTPGLFAATAVAAIILGICRHHSRHSRLSLSSMGGDTREPRRRARTGLSRLPATRLDP